MKNKIYAILLILILGSGIGYMYWYMDVRKPDETNETKKIENLETDKEKPQEEKFSAQNVSKEEAEKLMSENEEYVIVDISEPKDYDEGHIEGAINIPEKTIKSGAKINLLDKEQLIFVYIKSGDGKAAADTLGELGYKNVKNMGDLSDYKGQLIETKWGNYERAFKS